MKKIKQQQGFTLLELLLVLVLSTAILVVALRALERKTRDMQVDKAVAQIQQILQAATAYYSANNQWPQHIKNLVDSHFLPAIHLSGKQVEINNPWGYPFKIKVVSESNDANKDQVPRGNLFAVSSVVSSKAYASAMRARLPFADISHVGKDSSRVTVTAYINVPGEDYSHATGINFANVYHSDALVPAPSCPGYNADHPHESTMVPQVFVVPASVSNAGDPRNRKNTDLASIHSFQTFAIGVKKDGYSVPGLANQLKHCPGIAGDSTYSINDAQHLYWRVCLTSMNDNSANLSNSDNRNLGQVTVFTRCAPPGFLDDPDTASNADKFGIDNGNLKVQVKTYLEGETRISV